MEPESFISLYKYYFERDYSRSDFVSTFLVEPEVLSYIWNITKFDEWDEIESLLYYFARLKTPDPTLCQKFGLSKKIFQEKVWLTMDYLYDKLDEVKISNWINQDIPSTFRSTLLCVDTTPYPHPTPQSKEEKHRFWSDHYHMYCYKYQFVCNRMNGLICCVDGPFYGSSNDKTIFKETRIEDRFPNYINFFGDGIYSGEDMKRVFIGFRISEDRLEELFSKSLSRERIIIENVHHLLKPVNSTFVNVWHYGKEKHMKSVNIMANVVNIQLKLGHQLRKQ